MICPFCQKGGKSLACSDCVNYACEKSAAHAIALDDKIVRAKVEAEIVAWLRESWRWLGPPDLSGPDGTAWKACPPPKQDRISIADRIERGEHRAKK